MKIEKTDDTVITVTLTGTRAEVQTLFEALATRRRTSEQRAAMAELYTGLARALGVKAVTPLPRKAKSSHEPLAPPDVPQPSGLVERSRPGTAS